MRTPIEQLKREALAGVDAWYVEEILAAAKAAKVSSRVEWHRLTLRDCAAGYHSEVAEAERLYFKAESP